MDWVSQVYLLLVTPTTQPCVADVNNINNKSMSTHINHNNIKNINIATTTKKKKKERAEELLIDELLFSASYDLLTQDSENLCHSKIKIDIPHSS